MSDDIQYADAVDHLHVRKCTIDDIELFNSHIIKSVNVPNGLCLENISDTCAIVAKNHVRETLNNQKTIANCTGDHRPTLIHCHASNSVHNHTLNNDNRGCLLKIDMSSKTSQGSLPGVLPLYIGAPVILKNKNISVELGITNGQQGFVQEIYLNRLSDKFVTADIVLVEFPNLSIKLANLPKGYYPVQQHLWNFATTLNINGNLTRIKVTRHQQPLQLGFAITAHSAQGKTMSNILCSLHNGGYAAYVAASRATTHYNLFITDLVTLKQLNRPINHNLLEECCRLDTLIHNTLVNKHYLSSDLTDIPRSETESDEHLSSINVVIDDNLTDQSQSHKRHNSDDSSSTPNKKN